MNPLNGLRASSLPKGLNTVRGVIAHAVAKLKQIDPVEYAINRWGEYSPAVAATEKAAAPALNVATWSGAQLNDTSVGDPQLFDLVYPATIVGRMNIRRIPFYTRMLALDEGPACGWRGQGGAFATGVLKATNVAGFERFSVGAVIAITEELLKSNTVDAEIIVRDMIVKGIAAQIDRDFISPTNNGSANVKPASVSYAGAAMDSPSEAFLDWSSTYTGDPNASWVVLNPWDASRLYGSSRPDIGVRGGTLAGFPALTSTAVPEGQIILLDPGQVSLAMDGVELKVSRDAAIELNSAPAGHSVTPAAGDQTLVSAFQENFAAVMGFVYANWALMKPGACKVYDLQSYGLAGGN